MKGYTLGLYEKAMPGSLTWKEKLLAAKSAGYDFVEISIDETDEKPVSYTHLKKSGNLVVKDATEDEAVIRKTFEAGEGILRLFPAFVPRRFGKAGRRLKLHPDDYFAFGMARGSITERWFASTIAAQNGELSKADERCV